MDLDVAKPCLLEILHRHLLAPHGAEAFATLRQGHRHAVQARTRVKQGTERVLPIALDIARGFNVLRQVDAVFTSEIRMPRRTFGWLGRERHLRW
jgi:hypothetical protein